jgi:hypothetical protein
MKKEQLKIIIIQINYKILNKKNKTIQNKPIIIMKIMMKILTLKILE